MKVNVRQKDIDKGKGGDGRECAVALAVRRAFKTDDVFIAVDYPDTDEEDESDGKYMSIRIDDTEDYGEKYIDKYDHILNFLDWFDNSLDGCEPFKFNIDTSTTTI